MTENDYSDILLTAMKAFKDRQDGMPPVWRPATELGELLKSTHGALPLSGEGPDAPLTFLLQEVLTRPTGNTSPSFFGWVHGGGDELGIAAAIIASGMNANTGGRDHGAVHIERTVIDWMLELFGFTPTSSGVLTQGTSESNLLALAVARTAARRAHSGKTDPRDEIIYVGPDVHDSVTKAARLLQFGPTRVAGHIDRPGHLDPLALRRLIRQDRARGLLPTCVTATAGSIDSGASDPFEAVAEVCREEGVWLHVDGAFGAWLRIAPPPFDEPIRGIEFADSLAFDFHKWLPVPFAVGALLVKNRDVHRATFANEASYLAQGRALAGGPDWAVNYGIALSRSFSGLAPYLILRSHGLRELGQGIAYCVVLAYYFAELIERSHSFALVAPVAGNVVLFEPSAQTDAAPRAPDVAADLQERGETVFSTTSLDGRIVLRACFVNHGTRPKHVEQAIRELEACAERASGM